MAIAAATYAFASSTASGNPRPRARWQAMAEENAQPVPWVELDRNRSDLKTSCSAPLWLVKLNRSIAFSRWPPVMTTLAAPISWSLAAATRICSRFVTASPVRAAASSTFGVMTVARGSNRSIRTRNPAAINQVVPGGRLDNRIQDNIRQLPPSSGSPRPLEPPSPTPACRRGPPRSPGPTSSSLSVSVTSSGLTASARRTPAVDWTVKAVMHPTP